MSVFKDRIEHVVVLMLENRSLDHVLGCLYDNDDNTDNEKSRPSNMIPDTAQEFNGVLKHGEMKPELRNTYSYYNGEKHKTVPLARIPCDEIVQGAPTYDPAEPYLDVNQQLYGAVAGPSHTGQKASMSGFLQNFYDVKCYTGSSEQTVESIMKVYDDEQLPVLNSLARHYAVSDLWFSSVPTQTNANRAFLLCGTSLGRTDNMSVKDTVEGKDFFQTKTIFNVLAEHDQPVSWAVFYKDMYPISKQVAKAHPDLCAAVKALGIACPSQSCYTQMTFPEIPTGPGCFQDIETDFKQHVAEGTLPAFSFLEPGSWGGSLEYDNYELKRMSGDDYHPPGPMVRAERFLADIYRTLTSNTELWNKTLFVVTFDEHGGTYDHVPPPWGAADPDGKRNQKYGHDFGFNRFGVRVPTLLISPWIEKGTVFRSECKVPYDHTSVIATVLDWKDISRGTEENPVLGKRVLHAPPFDKVLTRSTARTDTLDLPINMLDHVPPCMQAGDGGRWDGKPSSDDTWFSLNKLGGQPQVVAVSRTELHLRGAYDFIDVHHPLGASKGNIEIRIWQLCGDNTCQLQILFDGDLAKEYLGTPDYSTGQVTASYALNDDESVTYRFAGATLSQKRFSKDKIWYAGVQFDLKLSNGNQYYLCFEDMGTQSE